jgi:hypothetical protein
MASASKYKFTAGIAIPIYFQVRIAAIDHGLCKKVCNVVSVHAVET